MTETLTPTFLQLLCEKNSDGTKSLRLKGKELWQRKGKRIEDLDMKTISAFLTANYNIVKLDLCYNNIGDRGIDTLARQYLRNEENTLEHLNLIGCNLGPMAMKCLHRVVKTLKLKTLRLTGNKIGVEGGKYLGMILAENQTINHLDLGETDQTLSSLPFLLSAIRQDIGSNKTLKVLDVSRVLPSNPYHQCDAGHLSKLLGNTLKVNSTLIELHVQKCEIDGHDVELLLAGMSGNTSLLLLDLGYNRIGDYGIELIAKWLRARPALLGLNVAGNGIKDIGARAISFHMPFSKLRLLDISQNRITDEGMLDVLNTIKKPYLLRLLYIWGNQMTERTLKVIDRMILSGVLQQDNIDVKLYKVDGVLRHAFYPSDHYKQRYYCVADYGCAIELRIRRNMVEDEYARPRHLVKFQFYPRVPAANQDLPPIEPPC